MTPFYEKSSFIYLSKYQYQKHRMIISIQAFHIVQTFISLTYLVFKRLLSSILPRVPFCTFDFCPQFSL